jgi:hypothetical protein
MSACRTCGREIVWKTTQHGKKVPLDPKALVFSVVGDIAVKPTPGVAGETFMVSHFATCPDANEWSKNKAAPADRHFSEPQTVDS